MKVFKYQSFIFSVFILVASATSLSGTPASDPLIFDVARSMDCVDLFAEKNEEVFVSPYVLDTVPLALISPEKEWSTFFSFSFVPLDDGRLRGTTKRFRFSSDSVVINGDNYFRLLENEQPSGDSSFVDTGFKMKEVGGKVYLRGLRSEQIEPTDDSLDLLLYDFSALVGDTLFLNAPVDPFDTSFNELLAFKAVVGAIDTIVLGNGEQRRRWLLGCADLPFLPDNPQYTYIEGIGNPNGLLYHLFAGCNNTDPPIELILCYKENGENLFPNLIFDAINPDGSCFADNTVSVDNLSDIYNEISVFPNPSSGVFTVRGVNIESVILFSLAGEIFPVRVSGNEISTESLPAGVYIVRITDKDGRTAAKRILID